MWQIFVGLCMYIKKEGFRSREIANCNLFDIRRGAEMVLLEKLRDWLPLKIPDEGEGSKYQRSMSMPASPGTPTTPLSARKEKDNVWRSVFNPGSNLATKEIGAAKFDKQEPNSPTVYDWLYSGETRSKHHR